MSQDATELHFSRYLNAEYISKIREEYKFQDSLIIEQFIMDYELFYHLQGLIVGCVVRGGMAVPFHLPDKKTRRLSVDIDVVTKASEVEVRDAMKLIGAKLARHIEMPDVTHKPDPVTKELPLLTYYIPYRSSLGIEDSEVKIEVWYAFDKPVPIRNIERGFDLFSFATDFPIDVFAKGALIGDKLTTLALNSIGVPFRRYGDIPKHLYDISNLLRTATPEDMMIIPTVFKMVCEYENTFFRDGRNFTPEQVINDILRSLEGLLTIQGGYRLSTDQMHLHTRFRSTLLGQSYSSLKHISDVLLVRLLAAYLRLAIINKMNTSDFASNLFSVLESLRLLPEDAIGKKKIHNETIAPFRPGNTYHFAKRIPVDQAVIYCKIKELEKFG